MVWYGSDCRARCGHGGKEDRAASTMAMAWRWSQPTIEAITIAAAAAAATTATASLGKKGAVRNGSLERRKL